MIRDFKNLNKDSIKDDIISGIVVFLVAIPLCLGIALASGAPLISGLISGLIGGIVVGALSESSISVSGPAAGVIAVVIATITQLGGFENFLLALMLAGILQIIISLLRAGFIADYVPSNVIQGLLCAIGILIIVKQLPLAFTHPGHHLQLIQVLENSAQNLELSPLLTLKHHIDWGATLITLLSIACLLYSDNTKNRFFKMVPGPIVVVVVGIIINEIYGYCLPNLIQNSAQLVNIPVNDHFRELFAQLTFPNFHSLTNPNVYLYAFIITAVVSLETLLNLEAAEKLDKERKYCSRNRELLAQGVGNMLSGLIGGLPITSVIVRTSVNIQTGARTKLSTIIHGFLFLPAVMLIPNWLNRIPLASLAAILIYIGYKLTKFTIYKKMYQKGFAYYAPFLLTVVGIVFSNILLGVIIGLLASIFFILKENSQMRLDIIKEIHPSGTIQRIILPQQLSFLKKGSLIAELLAIPENSRLIVDARYTKYIDIDNLEFIKEFSKNIAPNKHIELNLIGFKNAYKIHDHIDFINATTYDVQSELTPLQIIQLLKEGNARFVNDQRINRHFPIEIKATANDQYPIAVILSCIDSRVPVEIVFDMGVGDLFIIRVAGNVVNDDVIASLEFACDIAKAKLIVVLGHTRCGAIKAACEHQVSGHLTQLIEKIMPAVNAELASGKTYHHDDELKFNITKRNIINSVNNIYESSTILKNLIAHKKVAIASAMYDISSGEVEFFENSIEENVIVFDDNSASQYFHQPAIE